MTISLVLLVLLLYSYAAPTNDVKTACIPGSYLVGVVDGNVICDKCLAGTFSVDSNCFQCPQGKTTGLGASICTVCPSGKMTFTAGSPICHNCPAGFYSSSNHTECLRCEDGKISDAGSESCKPSTS